MRRYLAIFAIALALASSSALADTVTWITPIPVATDPNYAASIDWNNGANWSTGTVPTAADDVVFDAQMGGSYKTILLNGNQAVNSLSFIGTSRSNNYNPGVPADSALTITSGNILFDSLDDTYGSYIGWGTIIPDTVTTATWAANTTGYNFLRQVTAAADTTIVITKEENTATSSNRNFGIEANNLETLASPIEVRLVNGSGSGTLTVRADYALGTGQVTFFGNHNFNFAGGNGYALANDIHVDAATLNIPIGQNTVDGVMVPRVVTFEGNLTGTGNILKQSSSSDSGYLVLAGDNNTLSGTLTCHRGGLMLDGTFTGLGNIESRSQYASSYVGGVGTVGMASGAYLRMGSQSTDVYSHVVPGRDNEIGTLTIGTVGNDNVVRFETRSRLMIDIDGTTSDLLAINGTLNLDYTGNALWIDGGLDSATTYTLATFTAITGVTVDEVFTPHMFKQVFFDGVEILDPLAEGAFGTTHSLVYNADSIQLVALNAGPEYLPGDCNKDMFIDGGDLATLGLNWSPGGTGKTWEEGDFNGDGAVDGGDLAALGLNWAPGGYTVPEPATMVLLSIGGLALIRRRK